MATELQKRALDELVELGGNKGSLGGALVKAGYSPTTAKTPQKVTESVGFKQLCEERGLTDDLLVDALVEDIKAKQGNRKAELELGFRVKGKLSDTRETNLQVNIIPIYGRKSVSGHDSDTESIQTQEEN